MPERDGRYRSLVETIPHGIEEIDTSGMIIFANTAYHKMMGYEEDGLIGIATWDLLDNDSAKEELQAYLKALVKDQPSPAPYFQKNRTKAGRVIDVRVDWNYKRDEQGRVTGFISVLTDITDEKAAKKVLKKECQALEHIVNHSPAVGFLWRMAEGWPVEFVSENVQQFGYSAEDFYERRIDFASIVHPDDLERVGKEVADYVQQKREEFAQEYRIITRTGETRWVDDRTFLRRDAKGIVTHAQGIVLDITKRKITEDLLRDSEEKYRRMNENIPCVVYSAMPDEHSSNLFVSGGIEELTGYADRDFLKNPHLWEAIILPEDKDYVYKRLKEHRLNKCRFDAEYRIISKDNRVKWVKDKAMPVLNETQEIIRIDGFMEDITGRKRTEEALEKSEQEKTIILENMTELVLYVDTNRKILWANRAAAESVNLPADALIGRHCYKVWFQRSDPCPHCPATKIFETGRAQEREMYSPDGRVWHYRGYPVEDANGKIKNIVEVVEEITERKKTENALRLSEERLDTMLRSIGDHMSMMDKDLTIIWANEIAKKNFGDDIIGKKCFEAYHQRKEPCEPHPCLTLRAFQDGKIHDHNTQFVDKNGKTIYFHCTANVALRDEEGNPTAVIETSRDVTDVKRAEKALGESEKKYRSLINDVLDSSSVGTFILDKDFQVVWVNRALERYFGITRDEIIGRDKRKLIREKIKDIFESGQEFMGKVLATYDNNTYTEWFECHVLAGNGREERWLEHWSQPVKSGLYAGGRIEHYSDITEYKKAEEQKKEMQTQLSQAQKMEAVGRLAGGIAHDFNNLLQTINGYSGLILSSLGEGDPLREDIEEILGAGREAAALTDQLLAFSRKQKIETKPIDLNALIKGKEKMLQRLIGEDIQIVTNLAEQLNRINADTGQIRQVIMNLAINARDAMSQGGRLTITTENVRLDSSQCMRIPGARPGTFVCLSVSDTGTGIEQAELDHIFEPFYTTKGPGEGTGLGLPTVYGIIKQHEGFITVSSKPRKGTTFNVYLPVCFRKRKEETLDSLSPQEAKGTGERILLVEDEKRVRKFATRVLRENGYVPFPASSGTEALSIFEQEDGRFDLVLSDVVLPDMRGPELIDHLLMRRSGLRVILASGYTDDKAQKTLIEDKGYVFLKKPYKIDNLLETMRDVLDPGN